MNAIRALPLLLRHGTLLWRSGQLRFRLETYGLYYPALPYRAPAWRISLRYALFLGRSAPSYARWLAEMDDLAAGGPRAWWAGHGVPSEVTWHDE